MAVLSYEFQVINSSGAGVTGIAFGTTVGSSPGIVNINKLPITVGGALVAISSPTISFLEIGQGYYTVQFDAEAQSADVALLLDAANSLTGANRYILVALNRDSGRIITDLDATISSRLPSATNAASIATILGALPSAAPNTPGGLLAPVLASGTARVAGSSSTKIQLQNTDTGTAGMYVGARITLTGGTGAGQSRVIATYDVDTAPGFKIATLASGRTFSPAPDNTTTYIIVSDSSPALNDSLQVVAASVVAAVTAASVTGNLAGDVVGNVRGNLQGAVGGNILGNVNGSVNTVLSPVTAGTVSDKTGYALTAGEHTAISGTDVPAGLVAGHVTTARADRLDYLDADVSATMLASSYVAPNNAGIASALTALGTVLSDLSTILGSDTTLLAAASAIQAKTDLLTFTGSDVHAVSSGGGAAPTVAEIWAALTSGLTTAGSIGKLLGAITYTGTAVNAFAVNTLPPPGALIITVPVILADAELAPGPTVRNITIVRGTDLVFDAVATAADGVTPVNITGCQIELLVKGGVEDDDTAALLHLDSHLIGGITLTDAPNGVFHVVIPHAGTTSTTLFREQHPYTYGVKIYLASGLEVVPLVGSFQVRTSAISSTITP